MLNMNKKRFIACVMVVPFAFLVGCSDQGPAEEAGEQVDEAVEDARDAVDPAGPAEEAGREIDDAVEAITDDDED